MGKRGGERANVVVIVTKRQEVRPGQTSFLMGELTFVSDSRLSAGEERVSQKLHYRSRDSVPRARGRRQCPITWRQWRPKLAKRDLTPQLIGFRESHKQIHPQVLEAVMFADVPYRPSPIAYAA